MLGHLRRNYYQKWIAVVAEVELYTCTCNKEAYDYAHLRSM